MGQSAQNPQVGLHAEERRTYRRAPLRVPALLDAGSSWQKCETDNVSAGGVAVRTDHPLAVGALVEVYFELPFSVAVEAKARVVRWADGILALEFVQLERDMLVALRGFCRISTTLRVGGESGPGSR